MFPCVRSMPRTLVLSLDPRVIAAISNARPEGVSAFPAYLERLACRIRVFAAPPPAAPESNPDDLSRGTAFPRQPQAARAARPRSSTSASVPWQLGVARELIRRLPGVQFVLDHCGLIRPIRLGRYLALAVNDLSALAALAQCGRQSLRHSRSLAHSGLDPRHPAARSSTI